jgi:hypothetical protein
MVSRPELVTNPGQIRIGSITSSPTDEEVAAIMAAIEATSPRAVVVEDESAATPPWRFSGRWWRKPVAARRDRPW